MEFSDRLRISDRETKYYGKDLYIIIPSSVYVDNFSALKKYILTLIGTYGSIFCSTSTLKRSPIKTTVILHHISSNKVASNTIHFSRPGYDHSWYSDRKPPSFH